MTRINVVPASELSTKHLIAEYRELPRIFGLVKRAIDRGESPNDSRNPLSYTLGKGHVRFFYPRLGWLLGRQQSLIAECLQRGFNISHTDTSQLLDGISSEWINHWTVTPEACIINRQRIKDRTTP